MQPIKDHNTNVKGTVVWDFFPKVILPKLPNWSPDLWKAVLNIDSILVRYSNFSVVPRFGPLGRIWLCAMGHYGKFGFALWDTPANLDTCYGPLQWIWLCTMGHCVEWSCTIKICNDFRTIGHSTGVGDVLWAVTQDLFKRYRLWRRIWLCAIGHNAKPVTVARNCTTIFFKFAISCKVTMMLKSVCK
jgi:hypothetical protein